MCFLTSGSLKDEMNGSLISGFCHPGTSCKCAAHGLKYMGVMWDVSYEAGWAACRQQ